MASCLWHKEFGKDCEEWVITIIIITDMGLNRLKIPCLLRKKPQN